MKKTLFISFILSLGLHYSYAQEYKSTWESIDSRPIPEWFSEAKFGIFIHWGLYSVPAWAPTNGPVYEKYSEWYWARQNPSDKPFPAFTDFHNKMYGEKIGYTDFVSGFKAEMFDPAKWAEIFKQSGAKYIVLTSKHHDGFALWPSEQAWNWNSEEVGPHRDLAGDLSEAIKQSGMHMGFYYSLYEWYNPLYKKDLPKYVSDHMIPQMKDLVNRYQPDIVWTDGEWELTSDQWKSTDFLAWLYNESPVKNTVVVNDRWGKETRGKHGGIYTTEYDLVGDLAADRVKPGHPWEECRGIGGSFGYNRNENLENYETSESLIRILIDKVSMGGNLLPSEQAWNWNSEEVGPHRDLAGDLSEAIKQSGMHMGFYYSLYEWYNPLYKKDLPKYVSDHMIPQMKDLVNRYQPDIVWTDGEWELTSDQWKSTDFLAWLYNESPVKNTVVVNDRWGKETRGKHGGIYTTEYDLVGDLAADRVKPGHPWEECRGIGGSFGYNRNENLENYETSESLIRILIDKVSMGGNLLLNVGPTADGRIPVIMQQRLKDIGDWLSVNGDAIYGTHAWKYTAKEKKKEQTIFFTAKGDDLYVIITRWQNQPIKIEGVSKTDAVNMLGFNRKINYTVSKNSITIHLPEVSPADNLSSYAWVFKVTGGAK